MTEAQELRAFTVGLLEDVGGEVRDDGVFLWLRLPESAQGELDLPAQACLTFDPDHVGEFDAELVAPGSYVLEKLLGLATRRGRWDVARLVIPRTGWLTEALARAGVRPSSARGPATAEDAEEPLFFFAFRTALTSDEKREGFHLIAVAADGSEGWRVPWPLSEEGLAPASVPGFAPDLSPAYRKACQILEQETREETEAFRRASLTSLEEEVRRVFRYFDGTVGEVRAAAPSGAEDVVRAIEAERDRRLAEALERFEPHGVASLCSVRILLVPTARVVLESGGGAVTVTVDALTGHLRGVPPGFTGAGPARLPARPRSGTPRPRTTAGPAAGRSPRGSTARSRSGASRRRGS